jgi:hypothetical protein
MTVAAMRTIGTAAITSAPTIAVERSSPVRFTRSAASAANTVAAATPIALSTP